MRYITPAQAEKGEVNAVIVKNYKEMKIKHNEEYTKFSAKCMFYAFDEKQFKEGLKRFNLYLSDIDKVKSIGAGAYILKDKEEDLKRLFKKQRQEIKDAIETDETGDNFIYSMFLHEMNNYEYSYTEDLSEILRVLGLTYEEIQEKENLKNGLLKAIDKILESEE